VKKFPFMIFYLSFFIGSNRSIVWKAELSASRDGGTNALSKRE